MCRLRQGVKEKRRSATLDRIIENMVSPEFNMEEATKHKWPESGLHAVTIANQNTAR